jgi:hypothetical protein
MLHVYNDDFSSSLLFFRDVVINVVIHPVCLLMSRRSIYLFFLFLVLLFFLVGLLEGLFDGFDDGLFVGNWVVGLKDGDFVLGSIEVGDSAVDGPADDPPVVVDLVGDAVSIPVKDGGVVGLFVVGSSVDTSTNSVGRSVAIDIGGDDVATGASIITTGGGKHTNQLLSSS